MRSQGKKVKGRLLQKESTQAFYKRFAGRCTFELSWQQADSVSYIAASAAAPDKAHSREERLPAKGRTASTFLHSTKENALGRNLDPWVLRDRLLRLDFTTDPELPITLRDFLGGGGFVHDIPLGKKTVFPLPPEQISEWQERQRFLIRWLQLAPGKWASLQKDFPNLATYAVNGCGQFPSNVVSISWQDALPVIRWTVQDAWSAVVATVHFDKMIGIGRLRTCKVCGAPVPDRHREPYCSEKHRHLATVRRLRAS
jgi:hypothetical protein